MKRDENASLDALKFKALSGYVVNKLWPMISELLKMLTDAHKENITLRAQLQLTRFQIRVLKKRQR